MTEIDNIKTLIRKRLFLTAVNAVMNQRYPDVVRQAGVLCGDPNSDDPQEAARAKLLWDVAKELMQEVADSIIKMEPLADAILFLERRRPEKFMDMVPGMRPVNREDLAEYERAMREEVIPELVKQQNDRYWGKTGMASAHSATSETPVARLG